MSTRPFPDRGNTIIRLTPGGKAKSSSNQVRVVPKGTTGAARWGQITWCIVCPAHALASLTGALLMSRIQIFRVRLLRAMRHDLVSSPSFSSSNAETPHPNPNAVAVAGEHLDIASISDQGMRNTYRVSSISAYTQPFPTAFHGPR